MCDILLEEGGFHLTVLVGKQIHLPGSLYFFCRVGRHEQFGKGVVLSLHSGIVKGERPLREDDGDIQLTAFGVHAHQGQRVSAHNV